MPLSSLYYLDVYAGISLKLCLSNVPWPHAANRNDVICAVLPNEAKAGKSNPSVIWLKVLPENFTNGYTG